MTLPEVIKSADHSLPFGDFRQTFPRLFQLALLLRQQAAHISADFFGQVFLFQFIQRFRRDIRWQRQSLERQLLIHGINFLVIAAVIGGIDLVHRCGHLIFESSPGNPRAIVRRLYRANRGVACK